VVRRGSNGTCACTNHFCTPELKAPVEVNILATFDRFASLTKVAELERKLSPADLQVGLHQANIKNFTLQTMVFECDTLRLHLAAGMVPASAGEMRVLDLAPLLHSQPRPAR
jgi:hypothetical protein